MIKWQRDSQIYISYDCVVIHPEQKKQEDAITTAISTWDYDDGTEGARCYHWIYVDGGWALLNVGLRLMDIPLTLRADRPEILRSS